MDSAPDIAATLHDWLAHFGAAPGAVPPAPTFPVFREIGAPPDPAATIPALAALAAEALARDRTLWIVTADDALLPDISNALDLRLRPLCLVQPGADYAGRIALRATLSLLKSRLARAAEDSEGPAWLAMRTRLQADDALWRAALAWSARGLEGEAPPAGIGNLFPVRIGPQPVAERLAAHADWVMLVQAARLPPEARSTWPGARCTLMLGGAPLTGATGLVPIDETARLRAELDVLGQELAEMELELATAQGELSAFSERYHALIAGRMAELDRVHADLAQLRLQQAPDDSQLRSNAAHAGARAEQSRKEHEAYRKTKEADDAPFVPSIDLKKRFRQLAQKIHPDRASDEADRAWRTQLMSEANRAYRAGDMAALDEVLALWLEGSQGILAQHNGAVPPEPTSAAAEALALQVARIRRRIAAIATELDRLYGSKLYELFAAARVAARQGRDLLEEMALRIDAQLAAAQAAVDALDSCGTAG
jgi:hypothetical protein